MTRKSIFALLLGGVLALLALGWGFAAARASTSTTQATVPAESLTQEKEPLYPDAVPAAATATAECSDEPDSAGLIPCGRYINDPATPWDECKPCGFCSFALSLQLITEFLFEITGVAAVLALVLGQMLAMTAVGQTDMMVKIKSTVWQVVLGFVYAMAAWILINAVLLAVGYTNPLGGKWYTAC